MCVNAKVLKVVVSTLLFLAVLVNAEPKSVAVEKPAPLALLNVWMYPLFGERITRSKFSPVAVELEQLLDKPVSLSVSNDFVQVEQLAKAGELDIFLAGNGPLARKLVAEEYFVKALSAELSILLYSKLPEAEIKLLGVPVNTMAEVLRAKDYADYPYVTYDNFLPMYKAYLAGEIDAMLVGKVSFYLLPEKIKNKDHIRREIKGEGEGVILFSKRFSLTADAKHAQQYFLQHKSAAGYFFGHDMGVEHWEIATEL